MAHVNTLAQFSKVVSILMKKWISCRSEPSSLRLHVVMVLILVGMAKRRSKRIVDFSTATVQRKKDLITIILRGNFIKKEESLHEPS